MFDITLKDYFEAVYDFLKDSKVLEILLTLPFVIIYLTGLVFLTILSFVMVISEIGISIIHYLFFVKE